MQSVDVISGSHTGERILDKYEEVMLYYQISDKVSYIVTDNAANMKKAFNTSFPLDQPNTDDSTDSDDLWHPDNLIEYVDTERERIACFAHSLQLTIADGLKETKAVSGALSKPVAVSNILHHSTSYKVRFHKMKPMKYSLFSFSMRPNDWLQHLLLPFLNGLLTRML